MRNVGRAFGVVGLALFMSACGSSGRGNPSGSGGTAASTGGASGQKGSGGRGTGGPSTGGQASTGGASGNQGGSGGTAGNVPSTGGASPPSEGNGGAKATGGATSGGGAPATSGGSAGGASATGGASAGGAPQPANIVVTSAPGAYWQVGAIAAATSGTADVTVLDSALQQIWYGFGGAFNELGWSVLTSKDMQDDAVRLLFSATDGANFAWGMIPIGASDYATNRYTLDDAGSDVPPNSDDSNRPAADPTLSKFSLERDGKALIPYVKAALKVKPDLRFWANAWTPPAWMKTGYTKTSAANPSSAAPKPSYFDGGSMTSGAETLTAYALYFTKFVQGYRDQGINIELVTPQNTPSFEQNYPSCKWDRTTYTNFVGKFLGPAMKVLNVSVMLGALADSTNNPDGNTDLGIATAVLADPAAAAFVTVAGVEFDMLDRVNMGTKFGSLPVWVTAHKFGNYPFCPMISPPRCPSAYNSTQAPNDQAYAVESWGYLRDAITKGHVAVYNAWNLVLDKVGLGIDTARDWKQDALLVADGGKVTATPAYYVFRHLSQYVIPGAKVIATTGGDAVAFKNPDGSLVAVAYNSGGAKPGFVIALGGKPVQFAMPANGWATVKVTP